MNITTRFARKKDAGAIANLIQQLGQSSGEASPVDEAYARQLIIGGRCQIILAEIDGRIVGLANFYIHPSLYHAGEACLIDDLVVDEAARGQGVGNALMIAVLRYAREEKSCAEISLAVASDNAAAQALYRKHGFVNESLLLERHW